jgi:hypothetical protein
MLQRIDAGTRRVGIRFLIICWIEMLRNERDKILLLRFTRKLAIKHIRPAHGSHGSPTQRSTATSRACRLQYRLQSREGVVARIPTSRTRVLDKAHTVR